MAGIVKRIIASAIAFVPVGTLISTSVQAAIAELETKLQAANAAISASVVPGTKGEFFMLSAPAGWLKANGAAVMVSAYQNLATNIYCGDANNATAAWGYRCTNPATPATTRNITGAYIVLPDARGEYSRGLDDGRGIDAGRSLWSWQAGQNMSHTHTATQAAHSHTLQVKDGGNLTAPYYINGSAMEGTLQGTVTGGVSSAQPAITVNAIGGTENIVRGLAALICIKY